MKIAEIDLARHLEEEFKSIYTIISEDFVLVEDLLASILTKAKIEDFLEKETYIIEKNSSWDFLSSENNNCVLTLSDLYIVYYKKRVIIVENS